MKKSVFALLLFSAFILSAQIPEGYYDTADGLSGEALKSALNDIIDGHTEYSYTSSSTDTWDILKEADRDPNNADNVLCIYSGFSRNGDLEYDNGAGWSREHVWAQSRGDLGTSRGPGTDIHHLRAADVSTNSARANRNFAYECDRQYVDGDGTTDSYSCSEEYSWEPPDAVKGDIARMLFYMATRYEGENGEPDLELTEELQDQESDAPLHGIKSVLLMWHEEDPVSEAERARNDIVYSYQNNRNPFIDHPEYVDLIWRTQTVLFSSAMAESIVVYPNPTKNNVTISMLLGITEMIVYDLKGLELYRGKVQSTKATLDVSNLSMGQYILVVKSKGQEETRKLLIVD